MKSFSHYINNNYTQDEIDLANEIAHKLHDEGSLSQFLRFAKEVPHDVLRECLHNACSAPAHKITSSRAAIFVSRVKNYKLSQHGNFGN